MNFKEEQFLLSQEFSAENDTENFVKYMDEKATLFEEEITLIYTNLNDIIKGLLADNPELDQISINNIILDFNDMFVICEETHKMMQFSKIIISKFRKLVNDKYTLEKNVDMLTEKNLTLGSELMIAKDENETKDHLIGRLEEEIATLQKENYQILNKLQEIESKTSQELSKKSNEFVQLNSFNQNYIELNEEKENLKKEIEKLNSKIRYLDNEIKTKYVLKSEHNAEILTLENDNKSLYRRIKNYENNTEKLKHEYHSLRNRNNELRQSISVYERKIGDISNNAISANVVMRNNINNDSNSTPLNVLFQNNEDDKESDIKELLKGKINNNNSNLNSPKEKHNITIDEIKIDHSLNSPNIIYIPNNLENKLSINQNNDKLSSLKSFNSIKHSQQYNLLNELKDDSSFLDDNKSQTKEYEHKISVTPTNIVSQMKSNEIHEDIKAKLLKEIEIQENGNIKTSQNKSKLQVEIPKLKLKKEKSINNTQFKEFFYLTYKAFRLNVDDIEPFLYLNHDHLFNLTVINKIPFNKYEEFIRKEYENITNSMKKRQEIKKQRYDTIVQVLSDRLY